MRDSKGANSVVAQLPIRGDRGRSSQPVAGRMATVLRFRRRRPTTLKPLPPDVRVELAHEVMRLEKSGVLPEEIADIIIAVARRNDSR